MLIFLCACPTPGPSTWPSGIAQLESERIEITELDLGRDAFREGSVRLANTGDADLLVTMTGVQDAPSFAADFGTWTTVVPGGSVDLSVRYAPVEPGWEQGSLQVTTTDPDRGVVAVALFGSTLGTRAVLDPDDRHLGRVGVDCEASLSFEVHNPTLNDLELEGFEVGDDEHFAIVGELPRVIEGGTRPSYELVFLGAEAGWYTTRVGVHGNADNSGGFLGVYTVEVDEDLEHCTDTGL